MNEFSVGQPVMVIGGRTDSDRKLIGHATEITRSLMAFAMPEDKHLQVYLVSESYTCPFAHLHHVYRVCDLMPLGPLDDEKDEKTDEAPIDEILEVTSHESDRLPM